MASKRKQPPKTVVPLPAAEEQSPPAEIINLEQYRRARRRQAQAQAFWAGRNRAMRRSGRAAA